MASLGNKRIGRYVLYALGEIVLVIVGILIALQINNRNEHNKNTAKVEALLLNIQRDLETNLVDLQSVIDIYERKDSMINMVLSDTLTEEDYQKDPSLIMLLTTYAGFESKDNSYKNLMRNSEFIPEKYAAIVPELDEIYLENAATIKTIQTEISDMVNENLHEWSDKHTWYLDINRGTYNPAFVEFFLTDPFYKNRLVTYQIYASDNLLRLLRNHQFLSAKAYRHIHGSFQSEVEIPEAVSSLYIDLESDEIQEFVGNYSAEMGLSVRIFEEDEGIKGQVIGQGSIDLFAKSDSVLFNPILGVRIVFGSDKNGNPGFMFYQNQQEIFFELQDKVLK